MKSAINNKLLKDLPDGDADIYDTRLIGFVLRARKSGRHSYRVNYARGKWATIGRVSDLKPAEAREQAQQILGQAAKGVDIAAERKRAKAATLREYLENVYAPWATAHRKDGTATVARLRRCFEGELGGKQLTEITPWLIEKWRSRRVKTGKAQSTINRDLSALKAALNRAVDWDVIDANPITKVKPTKLDRAGVARYLTDTEETSLRNALAERDAKARVARANANKWRKERGYPQMPALLYADHLKPMVLLALNTGLRRGELFNLRWADVDLDRASLTVQGAGAKSGQTRHVPLNVEAHAVLRDYPRPYDLVFPGKCGNRLNNVKKAWAGITKAAGLTDFRFHDLRHSFASRLVMVGVDLNTVRELLGHADIKMTLRYAHLAPEHKAQAVARLVAPVGQVTEGAVG